MCREPMAPAIRIGTMYSHSNGRGRSRRRLLSASACSMHEINVPASSTFSGLRPTTPNISCGNSVLLPDIGMSRISNTTPMRKSNRMNPHAISDAHRYNEIRPPAATAMPQAAPSSPIASSTRPPSRGAARPRARIRTC